MPVAHSTIMFDVLDCAVAPLLTDTALALPTYGTWVDVFGINEVSLDPNLVTAELKGDGRVIAKKGRIDRVNFSATHGRMDLDIQAILRGHTVTDVAAITAGSITAAAATSGATVITGTGITANMVGRSIIGTGIAADSVIVAVTGTTSVTVSKPTTGAITTGTLTVGAAGAKAASRLTSPAPLPYFGIRFQISDLDNGVGDLHVHIHKASLTGGTMLGSSSDNFGTPSFDAEGIALTGQLPKHDFSGFDTGAMMDILLLETPTPLV